MIIGADRYAAYPTGCSQTRVRFAAAPQREVALPNPCAWRMPRHGFGTKVSPSVVGTGLANEMQGANYRYLHDT